MTASRIIQASFVAILGASGLMCFGPWYTTHAVLTISSLLKTLSLIGASAAGIYAFFAHSAGDAQRRTWLVLGIGLAFYSVGQSILTYYQAVLAVRVPFPSIADPLFMLACVLIIWSLFSFCLISFGSGLPLGSGLVFWSPAIIVALVFVLSAYPMFWPILNTSEPWDHRLLNLFYPLVSFIALAPCTVMLRVGLKFRGGQLLNIWLPLTIGFAAVLFSDVLFSYLVTLKLQWIEAVVDFLYLSGYTLIFAGVLTQARMLGRSD